MEGRNHYLGVPGGIQGSGIAQDERAVQDRDIQGSGIVQDERAVVQDRGIQGSGIERAVQDRDIPGSGSAQDERVEDVGYMKEAERIVERIFEEAPLD